MDELRNEMDEQMDEMDEQMDEQMDEEKNKNRLWLKLLPAERDGNMQEVVETLSLQDKKLASIIAAEERLYKVLIYLLEHGVADVHYIDGRSNNTLHLLLDSCKYVNRDKRDLILQCVVKLVDAGVDVNQVNEDKETPIFLAARLELYDVVIYLLEHGVADVHYIDGRSNNTLHLLLNSYRRYVEPDKRDLVLQCVVKLVDAGVDVNQVNEDKETPIFIAARLELYDVVIYLLEHGVADVHYIDGRSNNTLHLLLDRFKYVNRDKRDLILQCVVRLVDAGVDVNQVNDDKETPIFIAARQELYEVVIYLLEHGVADVHYIDGRSNNTLHLLLDSCKYVNPDKRDLILPCVVKLVNAGVDVNQVNDKTKTPLIIAARQGLYEVVIYLLEHGVADVHYIDGRSNNMLHLLIDSCKYFNPDKRDLILQWVVRLVDAGVDVNQVNEDKKTPIFIAAGQELCDVVIYLLEHGVDVNHIDKFKRNILHCVLRVFLSSSYHVLRAEFEEKWLPMFNTLIKTGVNINQPDDNGNTPLFSFVQIYKKYLLLGYNERLYTLLKSSLDNCVPRYVKLINILLKAGCNVNHQNKLGQSALMYHLKFQADISILKLLIQHSDLSLTDENDDTAISYCVQYHMFNSIGVFKLLIDSGSDLMSGDNGIWLFHDILKCKRFWVFSYYIGRRLIVNGFTAEGENMLHLLAGVNYDYSLNKFQWLLNSKLDINHPCSKTNTSTMVAAFLLNSKYLELFTHHPRLEINKRNKQGHTALHLCMIGFTMFKDGLNKRQVQDVVKEYCTQIYLIYMDCIDILLGVDRIDVNIPDNRGRTSLMMAAMKNDRVLTRNLLQAGAIVTMLDYSGRSALQYLNIYQSVFDLTCFKLLLSNGNTSLLNLPCIDGNTIIQTALCFPVFWEPCQAICFIRYLVAENCCLQILVSSSLESNYNQINLTELNHQERDRLRKLLYLSGAEGEEIMTSLNFVEEDKRYERTDIIHSQGRAEFVTFCSNISLKSLCRRNIRQILGLGIKDKVEDLELPRELYDFLLLKDLLHPKDYNVDYIDDGYNYFDDDDDYDGYDIDEDRDDDYSEYKHYQYFTLNTDHELRQDLMENNMYPNGDPLNYFNIDAGGDDSDSDSNG